MAAFISFAGNHLKSLFNRTYASLLAAYILLSYFAAEIGYAQKGNLTSDEILAFYLITLQSVVILNCIYFIISHFRAALSSNTRDTIIIRLGNSRYFWGLVISYALYFIAGYVLPLLFSAALQQLMHGYRTFEFQVYFAVITKLIFYAALPAIILSILLIIWIKNELIALLVWFLFYSSGAAAFAVFEIITHNGTHQSNYSFPLAAALNALAITAGYLLSRRITEYNYNEKTGSGFFSFCARLMRLPMPQYHYRMLGLKTQALFFIFGTLGFLVLTLLLHNMNMGTLVISKIYSSVLIPLLFSINQYAVVSIDAEAGMLDTVLLRKAGYDSILLNRWLSMLVPQLLSTAAFLPFLYIMHSSIGVDFAVYSLLLNVLFSSMNFYFALRFRHSGAANIILGCSAYIMLREDVQAFISSRPYLSDINILAVVTDFNNNHPAFLNFIIVSLAAAAFIILITKTLPKLNIRENAS